MSSRELRRVAAARIIEARHTGWSRAFAPTARNCRRARRHGLGRFKERDQGITAVCSERFARTEDLFVVERIAEVSVCEPLTIAEKGWAPLRWRARMTVWEPRTAIVAGGGPVGLLAAMKLRLQGLDVTVVERQHKPEKEALLARIGAGYTATGVTPLATLAARSKRIDLVIDATGNAGVAFECMQLVGANGAVILTSVTGAMRSLELPADVINKKLVLDNVLVLCRSREVDDFRTGSPISRRRARWPGFSARSSPRAGLAERRARCLTIPHRSRPWWSAGIEVPDVSIVMRGAFPTWPVGRPQDDDARASLRETRPTSDSDVGNHTGACDPRCTHRGHGHRRCFGRRV